MEDKQLVDGQLGTVGHYDVEFKEGHLVALVKAESGPLKADMTISLDAGMVIDAIAKAIPGTIDDAILGVAKAALLGK